MYGNYIVNGDMQDMVRLSFFVEVGKAITRAKTIDETIDEVMNQIGQIFSPLNWTLFLKDSETGGLVFTRVVGRSAPKLQGVRLKKGEGIAGWIAESGQSVIIEDVSTDERFSQRMDDFSGFQTKSIIGVPLKTNDRVFGVIELINKINGAPFTPFELKVLTTIADFAAIAFEKAYYFSALKQLATTDGLTGVHNRRTFEHLLKRDIEISRRYSSPLSVLLVDVDKFKSVNDTYGHGAGDEVLRHLARSLVECVRKVDSVCRWGGDEFVILMPRTAREAAEEARRRILARIIEREAGCAVAEYRVSIGVHSVENGMADDLLRLLDADLYAQKHVCMQDRDINELDLNIEAMLEDEIRNRDK